MIKEHIREYLTPLWLFIFVVIGTAVGILWKSPCIGAAAGLVAFLVVYISICAIVKFLRIKLDKD